MFLFLENQGKRREGALSSLSSFFGGGDTTVRKGLQGGRKERREAAMCGLGRKLEREREREREEEAFLEEGGAERPGGAGRGKKSLPQIAGRPPHSPAPYVLYTP